MPNMNDKPYVPTEDELKEMGFIVGRSNLWFIERKGYFDTLTYYVAEKTFVLSAMTIHPKSRSDLEAIIRSLTP